jgi:four helix bundle protein
MDKWTHKDLDAWQQALDLAESTYRITAGFPSSERFGLVVQMRRAAVSVLSNIAEGAARQTRPDFLRFLHIARARWLSWRLRRCSFAGLN